MDALIAKIERLGLEKIVGEFVDDLCVAHKHGCMCHPYEDFNISICWNFECGNSPICKWQLSNVGNPSDDSSDDEHTHNSSDEHSDPELLGGLGDLAEWKPRESVA